MSQIVAISGSTNDVVFTYYRADGVTISKVIYFPKTAMYIQNDVSKNEVRVADEYAAILCGNAIKLSPNDFAVPYANSTALAAAIIALKDA